MSIIDEALKKTQRSLSTPKISHETPHAVEPQQADSNTSTLEIRPSKANIVDEAYKQTKTKLKRKESKRLRIKTKEASKIAATTRSWNLPTLSQLKIPAIHLPRMLLIGLGGAMLLSILFLLINSELSKPSPYVTTASGLTLNGTMTTNGQEVAVINGAMYHQGDVVDGNKVLAISLNQVTLSNHGHEYSLHL